MNEDGDTPLHTAARFNNGGAAEYLLKLSDVNAINNAGVTAFDIADQKQHQNVLRLRGWSSVMKYLQVKHMSMILIAHACMYIVLMHR